MKKVIMVTDIKLGCYGEDLRSRRMKTLKSILEDNKLIFSYSRKDKMFIIQISNLDTYKKVEYIYNNFMVDYDKNFVEVYVHNSTIEDGLFIIGLVEEEIKEDNKMKRVNIGCYGKDLRTKKMQNLRMILNDNNISFSYNTRIKMFDIIIENEQQNSLIVNLINTFKLDHEIIK